MFQRKKKKKIITYVRTNTKLEKGLILILLKMIKNRISGFLSMVVGNDGGGVRCSV